MKLAMFTHSIRSDWNHGNAHFLRGVVRSLRHSGHDVDIHEPANGWSLRNLVSDHGAAAAESYRRAVPGPEPIGYDTEGPDLDGALADVDAAFVNEWTHPDIVRAIAAHHDRADNYDLFFHDSHHRAISAPEEIAPLPLDRFTGVLAFGDSLRQYYDDSGLARAWTWHEAADTETFKPVAAPLEGDLTWIGNWGDNGRKRELEEFLFGPVERLGLRANVHGVRYPLKARKRLEEAGIEYRGWIANTDVPRAFGAHRATMHIPRRPYLEDLPGVPTIRMFEAFACAIPLAVARWRDTEHLFRPSDVLVADTGEEMQELLQRLMQEPDTAARIAASARRTILERHTCDHRVQELHDIRARLRSGSAVRPGLHIAFFGSSLLSSYWNGAATYYRGLLRALANQGHHITFYESDGQDRPLHTDMTEPDWARVRVYPADDEGVRGALEAATGADVVIKASGLGPIDSTVGRELPKLRDHGCHIFFWDVDAPATLAGMEAGKHPELKEAIPHYDGVFTYGGGPRVVREYEGLGARKCVPVYNGLDQTTHRPVARDPRFTTDLAFLGNRLPDREERVQEFFIDVADRMPEHDFLLGGAGWDPDLLPENINYLGHIGSADHNALNCSATAVLNVNRASMAEYGYSPPTRIFEAAGAGACIITDSWPGIDTFFEPGKEILVAEDGRDVQRILANLDAHTSRKVGDAARRRVLRDHTYARRGAQVRHHLDRLERKVFA